MSTPNPNPYCRPRVVNVLSMSTGPRVVIEIPDWHDRTYAVMPALEDCGLMAASHGDRVALGRDGWRRVIASLTALGKSRHISAGLAARLSDVIAGLVDAVVPTGAGRRPMPWARVVCDQHEPRVIIETGHLDRAAREIIQIATERAGHSGCRVNDGYCLTRKGWARVCKGMPGQFGNRSSTSEEALMADAVLRVVDAALIAYAA